MGLFKHGYSPRGGQTPEYKIWQGMWTRCTNPNRINYRDYGGRGISVHPSWRDFAVFLRDVGERPGENYTLERLDNDGDYEPGNCKWATKLEQARNSRRCHDIEYNGEKHCITEWAELKGLTRAALKSRLSRGWRLADALETPAGMQNPRRIYSNSEIAVKVREQRARQRAAK